MDPLTLQMVSRANYISTSTTAGSFNYLSNKQERVLIKALHPIKTELNQQKFITMDLLTLLVATHR